MNKYKTLIERLVSIANKLDNLGLYSEASVIDEIVKNSSVSFQASPLELAVALGLMPGHILEEDEDEEREETADKGVRSDEDIEKILEMLREEE